MMKSVLVVLCLGLLYSTCNADTVIHELVYVNGTSCGQNPTTQTLLGTLERCELFGNTTSMKLHQNTSNQIHHCYYNDTGCTELASDCDVYYINTCARWSNEENNQTITGSVTYVLSTGPTSPPQATSSSSSLSLSLSLSSFSLSVVCTFGAAVVGLVLGA